MKIHEIYNRNDTFIQILGGLKTHEFIKNDKNYTLGDHVVFKEFDDDYNETTGRTIESIITSIDYSPDVPDGYCVFSFRVISFFGSD